MSSSPSSFSSPLSRLALVASGAGLLLISTSLPAAASDQAQEYIQARKIALKDPKVQAAYAKADEKLDERIVEIDPSLKPYVEKRRAQSAPKAAPATTVKQPVVAKKVPAAPAENTTSHVVTKGETLSSIALQYKVSVASLKTANNITDERKLRVGQKLVIPSPKAAPAEKKSEPGFWDRLQNSF